MGDERHDAHDDGEPVTAEAVTALVEAQVEAARAGVFAAYLRARDRARTLAEGELGPADDAT